jgi:hypothetical protein
MLPAAPQPPAGAGLGATTNLGDSFPWGMWLGIDVLGGVAMAAGIFDHEWRVYALDRATGRVLWQQTAYKGRPRSRHRNDQVKDLERDVSKHD